MTSFPREQETNHCCSSYHVDAPFAIVRDSLQRAHGIDFPMPPDLGRIFSPDHVGIVPIPTQPPGALSGETAFPTMSSPFFFSSPNRNPSFQQATVSFNGSVSGDSYDQSSSPSMAANTPTPSTSTALPSNAPDVHYVCIPASVFDKPFITLDGPTAESHSQQDPSATWLPFTTFVAAEKFIN